MGGESFPKLVELVAALRAEDGCPWDRAQDHRSLRPFLLEEAHEAIAAIDAADPGSLADELGDVLLQVLLHAQIASEAGRFSVDEVIDLLSQKLIRRHPHVFGSAPREMNSIRTTWDSVKQGEGMANHRLPPLLEARKLAERLGGRRPIEEATFSSQEEEEGRRILAAIATAWEHGVDPELALTKTLAHWSRPSPEKR